MNITLKIYNIVSKTDMYIHKTLKVDFKYSRNITIGDNNKKSKCKKFSQ